MPPYFLTIKDLIASIDKCIFCQSKLKVILTNYSGMRKNLPTLTSKYADNYFKFNIKYNSTSINLNIDALIDTANNDLIFDDTYVESYNTVEDNEVIYQNAARIFTSLTPHIQIFCSSKKCGLNYHISSDLIKNAFLSELSQPNKYKLLPMRFCYETINVNKFCVQNDLIKNQTDIYSYNNSNISPITIDKLDFTTMTKDKLIKKINTLVIFS